MILLEVICFGMVGSMCLVLFVILFSEKALKTDMMGTFLLQVHLKRLQERLMTLSLWLWEVTIQFSPGSNFFIEKSVIFHTCGTLI